VLKRRKVIEAAIVSFFQRTNFSFESFVCDVVLSWKESSPTVSIIEFNPWFNDTGALLFSWKSEADRSILGGKAPFEFRVLEEVVANPYESIPYEFRRFFEQKRNIDLRN
jgi:hypothetical protein